MVMRDQTWMSRRVDLALQFLTQELPSVASQNILISASWDAKVIWCPEVSQLSPVRCRGGSQAQAVTPL